MNDKTKALRSQILDLVTEYHRGAFPSRKFVPGETAIPVSGRVFDALDLRYLVDASLDFWLTADRFNCAFEKKFAEFLGVKHVLTANSGSSANLLAVSALTSPKLGDKRLKPGDEVITVAAGFPTTVNPIIQNGLVPVFVDVDIPTYNIKPELIEEAVSNKTRAIILAHTLGNPFDLNEVLRVVQKYDLWFIEDCCDALGSEYVLSDDSNSTNTKTCGAFGHISTFSFYPAHHITMGEGGAVATNNSRLKKIIESFRDWGRDCWCPPGHDNTCGCRFDWELGNLPKGYDHKYIYSHTGYNLKITDMQAAVALAQMDKLEEFISIRRRNFNLLKDLLKELEDFIVLPEATQSSKPSWFGFPITLREQSPLSRVALINFLSECKIGTRFLFAGNITRQPYFEGKTYRILGELKNTDIVMENTFWVGVYPGLNHSMLSYICDRINYIFGKK